MQWRSKLGIFGCVMSVNSGVFITDIGVKAAVVNTEGENYKLLITTSKIGNFQENINQKLGENLSNKSDYIAQQTPPAPPINPNPDPNRDRFPQPLPEPSQPSEPQPPLETPPPVLTPPSGDVQRVEIKKIEVIGSSIFGQKELDPITGAVEGRALTLDELRKVADAITQLYLEQGYITSRAVLDAQTITNGVVKIRVIEGSLARIDVEGTQRLNPNYIRSRLMLGADSPLSTAALENQLRLLRIDPLFENVEASLRAGENVGESILTVRVTEAKALVANFGVDNYSPPSVGSERMGASLLYRNVTGIGDEASVSYYRAFGESNVYDFSYRVPVNAMNGTLQFRVAPNNNAVVQEEFREFDIQGNSELYEISYRQPLVRSPIEEFALSVGFSHQKSQTFLLGEGFPFGSGPDEDGVTRTSIFKFGQDYLRRDISGAWALRSQFNFGAGLLNATLNDEPVPDSRFISWTGQLQRVQRLNENNLLILQGDIQLSRDSLLPSQQFVIGGGLSVRGYRQNVRSGDIGFRLSAENRITIQRDETSGAPILQIAPFVDLGAIKNVGGNPNTLPSQKFIAGAGMGVLWEVFPGMFVRLDYALPLVDLDDRGNNAQDNGFYFSVNYSP
ncbi:MAG TPA: ShlB/FhaC/HecB family hemolysin secretion/activation protein [Halomicronema sp.]